MPARLCCARPGSRGQSYAWLQWDDRCLPFPSGKEQRANCTNQRRPRFAAVAGARQSAEPLGRWGSGEGAGRSRCAGGETRGGLPSLGRGPPRVGTCPRSSHRDPATAAPATEATGAWPSILHPRTPPATVTHPPSALGERTEQRRGELKKKKTSRQCHTSRCAQPALRRSAPCLRRL